jgi:dihydroorotate dehydrogenase electron transfer subunit
MLEHTATLVDQRRFGSWHWLTLHSIPLTHTQPGQFVALRCALPDSYDPLIRQPLFVANIDQRTGTLNLLIHAIDAAAAFLTGQPASAQLNFLGPLGQGWRIANDVRTLALLGTPATASALFSLAYTEVARGGAVSIRLATNGRVEAPPPFLLPAAAEYHVAPADDPSRGALELLDDEVLRWADAVAVALPREVLPNVADRIRRTRLQWPRGFAQVALLPPLACCVGVCGVCTIQTERGARLACTNGPIFDLHDIAR